jgi:hopanoid biosynthesis associated protein HpnK
MVSGRAVADAVARAKRMPRLHVGLHVTVTDASPVLEPTLVPLLVGGNGEFSKQLVRSGIAFAFSSRVRAQLADEIRAQFEAYRETGLALDHVTGHNHMHIHPVVLELILRIGRAYGVRAVRLPYEPFAPSWRAAHQDFFARFGYAVPLWPIVQWMRRRLGRSGVRHNDFLFGICDSGRMTADRVLALLGVLPDGVSEMHFHPATALWPGMPAYSRCEEELAALTNPEVASALREHGIEIVSFCDL